MHANTHTHTHTQIPQHTHTHTLTYHNTHTLTYHNAHTHTTTHTQSRKFSNFTEAKQNMNISQMSTKNIGIDVVQFAKNIVTNITNWLGYAEDCPQKDSS